MGEANGPEPWGRGSTREPTPLVPSPFPCAAPHTSVPPEIPVRLLLAPLDTLLLRRGLVQFPWPVLCNPAPCSDASAPTYRRDGYLEPSAGPLVAILAPAPFFGTCRKPSGASCSQQGLPGILDYGFGATGGSSVHLPGSLLTTLSFLRPPPPLAF